MRLSCLALLALMACQTTNTAHEPFIEVLVDSTTDDPTATPSITLPDARYDVTPQFASFVLENTGADILYITPAPPEGEGSELLVFDIPSYTQLLPGQKMPVETTLDRRTWRWSSGTYSPTLKVEARYFFAGQPADQPEDPSTTEAPTSVATVLDLTVNFTIDCDVDGDGVDAFECGGDDCDDRFDDVNPNAVEVCDGVDQNCNGARDEEAVDRVVWYYDNDRDGYGDSDVTTESCDLPSQYWTSNGDDCDDSDIVKSPGANELCDGIDNNCNDEIDEGC
jgi:hypothetical protein